MKHNYKRLFHITGILFFWFATANANTMPENHAVNGGLTIIPVDVKQKPEVYFNNKRIAVSASTNTNQWLLVVGIPLDNTQSIQQLQMKKPVLATIPFHVSDTFYKTQYLIISDARKVEPIAEDLPRIAAENKKMEAIYATYTQANPFSEKFTAPAHGPISSLFGLKRVYNKQPRLPHSGLDIAAPAGSPVRVISGGKVADVSDYFYTGNTVIVDHGMGIFSLYGHLKTTDVKKGDLVNQGQQVGLVGKTGRATGPHLHWSMIMNQTLVDPLLFVSQRTIMTVSPAAAKKKENVS